MKSMGCDCVEHLFTIGFALRRQLQVKQATIPRRNLHALVAQSTRPVRDISQIVEGGRIARKLGQEYRRSLNRLHTHPDFALLYIRQLIYTTPKMKWGARYLYRVLCECASWARLVLRSNFAFSRPVEGSSSCAAACSHLFSSCSSLAFVLPSRRLHLQLSP